MNLNAIKLFIPRSRTSKNASSAANAAKLLFVAASNAAAGDGSISNPYNHIDAALNYIIANGLQGLGFVIMVLNGTFNTALNLAQGAAWDFAINTAVNYTGVGYMFDDIGYNLNVSGKCVFTAHNGGGIRYGGVNRFQVFEAVSLTSKFDSLNFSSGDLGYSNCTLSNIKFDCSDVNAVTFNLKDYYYYGIIKDCDFTCDLGKSFVPDARAVARFVNCYFGTRYNNDNANGVITIPATAALYWIIEFIDCRSQLLSPVGKIFDVKCALKWNTTSIQRLFLKNFTFNGGFSFSALNPPLYTDVEVQYFGYGNFLQKNYLTGEPQQLTGGDGSFDNLMNPSYDPIIAG